MVIDFHTNRAPLIGGLHVGIAGYGDPPESTWTAVQEDSPVWRHHATLLKPVT
jgi:hypothetical protein